MEKSLKKRFLVGLWWVCHNSSQKMILTNDSIKKTTFWHDCDGSHHNLSENMILMDNSIKIFKFLTWLWWALSQSVKKLQNVNFLTRYNPVGCIFRTLSHVFLGHFTETTLTFVFTSTPLLEEDGMEPTSRHHWNWRSSGGHPLCGRNSKYEWPACFGKASELHRSYLKGLKGKTYCILVHYSNILAFIPIKWEIFVIFSGEICWFEHLVFWVRWACTNSGKHA